MLTFGGSPTYLRRAPKREIVLERFRGPTGTAPLPHQHSCCPPAGA
jgi:hypothetical protein